MWLLRGVMITPVKTGARTQAAVYLRISGAEPRLEETLEGLIWLRQNGTLRADIVIEDAGMDEETKEIAILSARSRSFIILTESEETDTWEQTPNTSK